jgi:lipopolysaccharide export system permease protein
MTTSPTLQGERPASRLHPLLKFVRMRVIGRYLLGQTLTTFLMSLLVVTFVMLTGSLVQIIALIFKNVSVVVILQLLAVSLPSVISYALPFSMAAATLLVYSRLSADGEITAMKATGISIARIAAPPIALSIVVALIAVPANNILLPQAHFARSNMVASYSQADARGWIETGRWTPISRYRFYVNSREGDMYRDVSITEELDDGRSRLINAKRGFIRPLRKENQLKLELYDFTSEERSPEHTNSYLRMSAGRFDMFIDISAVIKQSRKVLEKAIKPGHMTTARLRERIAAVDAAITNACVRRGLTKAQVFAQIVRSRREWRALQRMPVWKRVLRKRGRTSRHALEDIDGRQLLPEYRNDLIKLEGANGPVQAALDHWNDNWPREVFYSLESRSSDRTEIQYRLSYAFAAIAFTIIGVPLGIRAHRSEKTIGFLICLALIAVHYAMVISIKAFSDAYAMRPDILIWVPDLVFLFTGAALLWRIHRFQ